MKLTITQRKTLPIGIDLGTSSIKLAQLQADGEAINLIAAASVQIPSTIPKDIAGHLDFLNETVGRLIREHPFLNRSCILSLPAEATSVRHLKLPKMSPQETAKALQWELAGKLPYPIEESVVRYVPAGETLCEGENRQELIAVCVPRCTVHACIGLARANKLDLAGINIEPFAIAECFNRLFRRAADLARTILFIDIGAASTQVVMTHGNKVAFTRNLCWGGENIDQALGEQMNLAPAEANRLRRSVEGKADSPDIETEIYRRLDAPVENLAQELTQCLRYYESVFRNQTVGRAIFLGGQAYDKRLCQAIARRINLPAQIGDPLLRVKRLDGAGMEMDRREPQPDWAVAVGLSLGAEIAA